MTNHMRSENDSLANIVSLSIEPGKADYSREREMAGVSERFLHSAALLPDNEILGWQVLVDGDNTAAGYAFSSSGTKITTEDLDWIFKGYGKTDGDEIAEIFQRLL